MMAEYHGQTLDHYLERIASGETVSRIAKSLGVTRHALHVWLTSDDDRKAAYKQAAQDGAAAMTEVAEAVLLDPTIDVPRARELAQHYRWIASKISPQHADKMAVEHSGSIDRLSDDQLDTKLAALMHKASAKLHKDASSVENHEETPEQDA